MTRSDYDQFAEVVAVLGTVFEKSWTPKLIDAYFSALSDLSIEQVQHAVNVIARTSKFFPKPAEIIEAAQGSIDDQAERAWTLFLDAVERHGVTDSLATDDPAFAQATIEAFGGWIRAGEVLHDAGEPMLVAYGKQWKASYRLALKQPRPDTPTYLPGSHEANNRQNCGKWAERMAANGRPGTYSQRVAIVADGKLTDRQLSFSSVTGMLTDESRALLAPASLQRLALEPARRPRLALAPAPAPDPAAVEYGEELLADWQRRFNPDGRLSLMAVIQRGLGEKLAPGWNDPPAAKLSRELRAVEREDDAISVGVA